MSHAYTLKATQQVLANEGTILLPTDTVWCIACDATNEVAVRRVLNVCPTKNIGDPPILLVDSLQMLKDLVIEVPPKLETLLAYHQRPLTLCYQAKKKLPQILQSNEEICIRVVLDPFCRTLIHQYGAPLLIRSTHNCQGEIAKTFGEISSDLLQRVDHVVDYRRRDSLSGELSIIARIGRGEELEFLRE